MHLNGGRTLNLPLINIDIYFNLTYTFEHYLAGIIKAYGRMGYICSSMQLVQWLNGPSQKDRWGTVVCYTWVACVTSYNFLGGLQTLQHVMFCYRARQLVIEVYFGFGVKYNINCSTQVISSIRMLEKSCLSDYQ